MRLLVLAAAFLAPLSARAFVDFTNDAFTGITVGHAFNLTWQGDGTPVTLTLMNGPTSSLAKVSVVATSAIGASYTWTPPSTLSSGTYALSITQSGSTNYSPQFSIAGGTGASAGPSPRSSTPNVAVPSTTHPTPPTSHPSTGTWAAFTALAAVVSQPPFPTGNSSGGTISPPSMTSSVLSVSYHGNSTIFQARAERIGVTGLAVAVVAVAAGCAIMA